MDSFRGAHAFVTGGASGIGLEIGRVLAAEGARVVLADIDASQTQCAMADFAGEVETVQLDVRDRAGWIAARASAEERFGPVDILVNNAGIAPDGSDLADMNPDSFDRLIAINLTGVFNGISTFGASMRARKHGHIVNTASISGLISCRALGAYCAAKFGVVGMSECLRDELEPFGVGVSVLCPGVVSTRLIETSLAVSGQRLEMGPPEMGGIDPAYVGARVAAAIKANDFYIFTHGEYADVVADHFTQMRSALATTPVSPTFDPNTPLPGSAEWGRAAAAGAR